ncbi:glycosyltransferase [soil metagenome]
MVVSGVTLAICSRDRPEMLIDAVNAVLAAEALPAELLVVDQSRTPNQALKSREIDRTTLRYIHSRSVGLSRSRNLAAARASQPMIAFVDDDVLVSPTWLADIVGLLVEAGDETVITGSVLQGESEGDGYFAPPRVRHDQRVVHKGVIRRDVLKTFNMAMYRSTFLAVGGLDESLGPGTRYPAAEDNDFGYRLLRAGFTIIDDPRPVVYHRAWRTPGSYNRLRWAYGRGQGAFFANHFPSALFLRRAVGTLLHRLAELFRKAIRKRSGVAAEAYWLAGFLSGYAQRLAGRTWDLLPARRKQA